MLEHLTMVDKDEPAVKTGTIYTREVGLMRCRCNASGPITNGGKTHRDRKGSETRGELDTKIKQETELKRLKKNKSMS